MKSSQLPGHGLQNEGRGYDERGVPIYGVVRAPGRGRCSCGAQSEVLDTTAARQRWHRDHKAEVQAQQATDVVAREFLVRAWDDERDSVEVDWANLPELDQPTLDAVVRRATELVAQGRPAKADFDAAYGLLATRAEVTS